MRVAIVGSRGCPPIDIESHLTALPDTIVSGGAAGADSYAKAYARKRNIPIVEFLPNYTEFGRRAPILRNIKIVENCDTLLAFWDGSSRGTKFTIDYAQKKGIPVKIVKIQSESTTDTQI